MIRRKLTAYTIMMIAGITAGYFLSERIRPFSAAGFLFTVSLAIAFFEDTNVREKAVCYFMLILGFILFTCSFLYYENSIQGYSSAEDNYKLKGRILAVEDKGEYLRYTVKLDEDNKGHNYKVIADFKYHSVLEKGSEKFKRELIEHIGTKAELSGQVTELGEADNPGCFDYRDYMRSKGIAFRVKVEYMEITDENDYLWSLRRALFKARENFLSEFDEKNAGFLRGLVFGDKSEIEEDVKKAFQLNSTGHILAVSGLHIGFLHALLKLLSSKKKTWPTSLFIIGTVIIYGEMTLWSSSVIRAVIVLSLSILSVNLRKPFDLLTSLCAAAFIILLFRPYMLFNSGFQLSFAAMSGIAFFSKRLRRFTGDMLAATLSVQIGTIPVIAMTFHRINYISILINIPIILLSSLIVPLCISFLFFSMIAGILPSFAIVFIQFCIEALLLLNNKLSFDGFFSELTAGFGSAMTVSILAVLIFVSSEWFRVNRLRGERKLIIKSSLLLIIPLMFVHTALYDSYLDDEIVFVSVGQGDCTHVRAGDKDVLIDGGGNDFTNIGQNILMPYLLYEKAKDIDIAVLTHLHKDHYLGISELSEEYPVSSVAFSELYKESFLNQSSTENKTAAPEENDDKYGYDKQGAADNSEISFTTDQIVYLTEDSIINLDEDISIKVLWPKGSAAKSISIEDQNENNMVYMINYKGISVMITGDLLEEDELKMLDYYKGTDMLKCDVLKVAHHGSKSSSSEEFLDAASPKIAVIQVGKNNLYGHPHKQTLERLESRGIRVYRTDLNGAVGVDISNKGIKIQSFR